MYSLQLTPTTNLITAKVFAEKIYSNNFRTATDLSTLKHLHLNF